MELDPSPCRFCRRVSVGSGDWSIHNRCAKSFHDPDTRSCEADGISGLTLGRTSYAWSSAHVLDTLTGGARTLVVLALHQLFINKHGILDRDLFMQGTSASAHSDYSSKASSSSLSSCSSPGKRLPVEVDTFNTDIRLLAFFGVSAVVAPFVGWYTRITRDLKWPLVVGWTLVLIGAIVFSTLG